MKHAPSSLLAAVKDWSPAAQQYLWTCRTLYHQTAQAADVGVLDEALKWGQPSWRPMTPRTGSTLRMGWSAEAADSMTFFVDCKTDIASRMADIYPDTFANDGRRQLALSLSDPVPQDPVQHLAEMTFCYHRAKRSTRQAG